MSSLVHLVILNCKLTFGLQTELHIILIELHINSYRLLNILVNCHIIAVGRLCSLIRMEFC